MNEQFDELQWGKVLAEAWIDPDFKARLEADPNATLREFARREFGMEIDCSFDSLTIPDAPIEMFAEHLSGTGASATATATATASTGGHVSATACATASAGGHVSATACGTASSGGHVSATACGTASSGGHVNKG